MMTILCPYCNHNTEIRTNGYYCYNCKRIINFFSIPTREQMGYDKKMWSEQELKKLILETLKEVSDRYEKEIIKRLKKELIGEEE